MTKKTIEEFLKMDTLPVIPGGPTILVMEMMCEEDNLRKISADLFGKERLCHWLKPENAASHVKEVTFYSHEERKTAYAKECWEGGIREAVAIELSNLLTDRKINYMLYDEKVIATESVAGPMMDNVPLNPMPRWYPGEYGVLEEFSRIIGLVDRAPRNVICTVRGTMPYSVKAEEFDFQLWNIDFGHSFHHDSGLLLKDLKFYPIPDNKETYFAGKEAAKIVIRNNMETKFGKLAEILEAIDREEFNKLKFGSLMLSESKGMRFCHPAEILRNYARSNNWTMLAEEIGLIYEKVK